MNRSISRRHLIAGGAGAAGAAAVGPSAGRLAATNHLPPGGPLVTLREPTRIFDSRDPGQLLGGQKLQGGNAVAVFAAGPAGSESLMSVFVNVTITETEGTGWLAVRGFTTGDDFSPDGEVAAPTTSNINWTSPGVTLANMALSPIGSENSIEINCAGIDAATHVIVDLQGYVLFPLEE